MNCNEIGMKVETGMNVEIGMNIPAARIKK